MLLRAANLETLRRLTAVRAFVELSTRRMPQTNRDSSNPPSSFYDPLTNLGYIECSSPTYIFLPLQRILVPDDDGNERFHLFANARERFSLA